MAFIEPRLIHLLNDATTPQIAHTDLPPFAEGFPDPSDRPLPLEPTTGLQDEQLAAGHAPGSFTAQLSSSGILDDGLLPREGKKDVDVTPERGLLGTAPRIPLRLLLGESHLADTSISSNRNPDDPAHSVEDPGSKKRQRVLASKDDMLHLPQPVKKQKAAPQSLPPMPPIINGLHEPPPNAALFPPISSTEFGDAEKSNPRTTIRDYQGPVGDGKVTEVEPPKPQTSTGLKTRKKAMKPRRKWSEEETKHLLLGVNRHGVGKWTDILADDDFRFNNRTAGDLKDRFRTCCPNELRKNRGEGSSAGHETLPTPPAEPRTRARTGLLSENILIEDDYISGPGHVRSGTTQAEGGSGAKKSRAHRKKLEDLAELGIHGPFKKSHRRERKPFSEQDDKQILEGLTKYGPAWTKIQRDPRYSLSGRQPTDLRDRVRNKYPDVYQKIEKGLFQVKDGKSSGTMEPTAQTSISNALQPALSSALDLSLPRVGSREDLPRWPLPPVDTSDTSGQAFDLGEQAHASFLGATSEMDISRLLLDDNQVSPLPLPARQLHADAGVDIATL